ncbi:hypothetical protein [Dyella acidiphila]|uniref:3-oxoacyl-ACP synthase n=1 Tax=Dyella acidiphila TaxID=2775866 RepID=A0ABR9GAJ3_9GAMM|nr:hypothetical protein [Dyella acidiphila]MBE1161083.1 hypothetical protein [Dyella acidiphila]
MIMQWRASNRVPNSVDIALYLVALPIALLLGYFLLRVSIDAIKRRARPATPAAAAAVETNDAEPVDPTLAYRVAVLDGQVLFAAGDTPAALLDAARAKKRASLHPQWHDLRGAPTFAAPVEAVELASIDETLPDVAEHWPEGQRRVLWLSDTLAGKMLAEHFDGMLAAQKAAEPNRAPAAPTVLLRLEWLLPSRWSDNDRQTAHTWLSGRLAAQGWQAPQLQVVARTAENGLAALKRLDELNVQFNRHPDSAHCLLLASDSHMDSATIAEWDASHQLHGAKQPEGRVPGEGASAVLLGAYRANAGEPPMLLHRMLAAQRAKPVDAPGKTQDDIVQQLLEQALAQAPEIAPQALMHLVSDTDMRPSRYTEALQIAEHAAPENDAIEALLPLACANGDCGAATALATVAAAAALAGESQQPCLVLSHHDASTRAVLLLSPPAAATEAHAAASSAPSLA